MTLNVFCTTNFDWCQASHLSLACAVPLEFCQVSSCTSRRCQKLPLS